MRLTVSDAKRMFLQVEPKTTEDLRRVGFAIIDSIIKEGDPSNDTNMENIRTVYEAYDDLKYATHWRPKK